MRKGRECLGAPDWSGAHRDGLGERDGGDHQTSASCFPPLPNRRGGGPESTSGEAGSRTEARGGEEIRLDRDHWEEKPGDRRRSTPGRE
ncbi:hypothetical protein NDU88_003749 [Pleurodeles waltl]|uniref:Uncharacterized protein n=1 Tax=Pleurodeles waltl TaxID=8319 RepID=A0AAV7PD27_PLEWA|nr:hypothetical protein NDU88_003749 [Pleurodeles waltl]